MTNGVMVPIICQAEHCDALNWKHIDKHGYYVFYFHESEFNKQRVRVHRLDDVERETLDPFKCRICHEGIRIFLMKKPSAMKFKTKHPDVPLVVPGQMRLPGEEESPAPIPGTEMPSNLDFIEIEHEYRIDKAYSDLIDEINTCFEYEAFSSALVMLRKLLENLIIDILILKYEPHGKTEMYFDETNSRFLPLKELVEHFEQIVKDYSSYGFKDHHLGAIKGFRKKGNIAAHNIVDFMTKKKLKAQKKNANAAVVMLLRILGIKRGVLDEEGKFVKKKKK